MDLEDIKQILELVREHELSEFELERDGLKVRIRKAAEPVPQTVQAPAPPVVLSAPSVPVVPQESAGGLGDLASEPPGVELAVVKSPIVGTFYRSSEPGAPPFVEVGDTVKKGQVLCIIEAMKLMNEIECECEGEIVAVYVENGQPVQFGDRLFAVKVK